jgi:hypothetical protein
MDIVEEEQFFLTPNQPNEQVNKTQRRKKKRRAREGPPFGSQNKDN